VIDEFATGMNVTFVEETSPGAPSASGLYVNGAPTIVYDGAVDDAVVPFAYAMIVAPVEEPMSGNSVTSTLLAAKSWRNSTTIWSSRRPAPC